MAGEDGRDEEGGGIEGVCAFEVGGVRGRTEGRWEDEGDGDRRRGSGAAAMVVDDGER